MPFAHSQLIKPFRLVLVFLVCCLVSNIESPEPVEGLALFFSIRHTLFLLYLLVKEELMSKSPSFKLGLFSIFWS